MSSTFLVYSVSSLFFLPLASAAQEIPAAILEIERSRAVKDSLLRHSPESPIPVAARDAFAGLSYFPVVPKYRIIGDLHVYGRRRQIQIPTTDGSSMQMERLGRFVASLDGNAFQLEVYRSLEDGSLEVFFKDATNSKETYSGGRYARLENAADGHYLLDFNKAYNPYCAYNPEYICPLPPPQNYLSFPIRAGEKNYGASLATH